MLQRLFYIAALAGLMLLAGACSSSDSPPTSIFDGPTPTPRPIASGTLADLEEVLADIYDYVNASVVNIQFSGGTSSGGFQHFNSQGLASGFVWDKEGHIVTNEHVVIAGDSLIVTFHDGFSAPAQIIGTDRDSDLAVIKVDVPEERLFPVEVADSTRLNVGRLVAAIGNPFGLAGTMTVGFVSALGRVLPVRTDSPQGGIYSIPDVIQTDASINPGNSGGVLVDSDGLLVGVPSAIISPLQVSAGLGFAIPSVIVGKVVPALIVDGEYRHSWLGIRVLTVTPGIAEALNLDSGTRGAMILEVTPGSPAERAGLIGSESLAAINGTEIRVGGDVVIAIDGHTINSTDDLITHLARYTSVNQTITILTLRDRQQQTIEVTLGARPTS
jgi:serine protease Do